MNASGIAAGDWVRIETPLGSVRSRAKLNASLDPQVVCGQHGRWQACEELGLPGYPPFGPRSANLNAVLAQGPSDPVSGSSPLRPQLCGALRGRRTTHAGPASPESWMSNTVML